MAMTERIHRYLGIVSMGVILSGIAALVIVTVYAAWTYPFNSKCASPTLTMYGWYCRHIVPLEKALKDED
jgi:hypothetical protein